MARAVLGRSQKAVEHLEEYFVTGVGFVAPLEPRFRDTHGIFHELPAKAADRGIRSKMVERNAATIRRIREDYPTLFEDLGNISASSYFVVYRIAVQVLILRTLVESAQGQESLCYVVTIGNIV